MEQDFFTSPPGSPSPTPPDDRGPEPRATKLSNIDDIFRRSLNLFKRRFWTFVGSYFVLFAIIFISILVPAFAAALIAAIAPAVAIPVVVVCSLVGIAVLLYGGSLCMSAFYMVIVDEDCTISQSLGRARPLTFSFLYLTVLFIFILLGGFFLFVIPGIIIFVWFYFAWYILVEAKAKGMNALLMSKEYVRGLWWGVFWRIIVIGIALAIVSAILNKIPYAGPVISNLILTPLGTVFIYVIYQDLKAIKGESISLPEKKSSIGFYALGGLGVICFIGLIGIMIFTMQQEGFDLNQFQAEQSGQQGRYNNDKSHVSPEKQDPVKREIRTLLNRAMPVRHRLEAARNLGTYKDTKAVNSLTKALGGDNDPYVRLETARALSIIGDARGVRPLIKALTTDGSAIVRVGAATALGELGDQKAIKPLKKALGDEDTVALAAQNALNKLSSSIPETTRSGQGETQSHKRKKVKKSPALKTTREKRSLTEPGAITRDFVINLASYRSEKDARQLLEKVRKAGHPGYTTRHTSEGTLWHRVRIGFYQDKLQAKKALKKLSLEFHQPSAWIAKPTAAELKAHDG